MRGLAAGGAGFSILAAFVALAAFGHSSGGSAESGEGGAATATARAAAGSGAVRSDAAGAAGDAGGDATGGDPAGEDGPPCEGGLRLIERYQDLYPDSKPFRHLIVLAPDPVAADDAELFDLALEGVDEAVAGDGGDDGYVHDHRWLPWRDAPQADRCWEKEPGVSVFRPLDGPDGRPPLLVLFVGETATWGLRPAQFAAAVDLVRRHDIAAGSAVRPVLVLGPTYSGTAASLSAMIRKPPLAGRHVRIVSGTTSTVRAGQILLRTQPPPAANPCAPLPTESGLVSYESATASDTCLLARLQEFLVDRGGTCAEEGAGGMGRGGGGAGNMVLFTETSTTYGSAGTEPGPERPSCVRRWNQPPDLGSIREMAAKPEAKSKLAAGNVAVHMLALRSTLDRMSNSKIRFAGIVATDPQNVLFLARQFRRQLPDIRLFTLSARIQYLDEDAADAVNGMLVVHSAPGDANHSMTLQNEYVRKIYYAARSLLAGEKLERDVRVSFIGNGRLWNIDDSGTAGPRGPLWSVGWQFALATFGVLFLAAVGLVILGARNGCWRPRGRLWALVAPCAHDDLRRQDHAISAALLLVCGGLVIVMVESMIARDGREPHHWLVCVVAALLTVRLACLVHLSGRRGANGRVPRVRLASWRGCVSCLWRCKALLPIAAPIAVLVLALYAGCGPERRATFYLLSGGSPVLVGLVALGSYALALLCARARLRMLDTHRFSVSKDRQFVGIVPPIAQALGEMRGEKSGLADVEYRLLSTLYHPWKYARVMPLAVHGLLVLTMAVPIFIKPPHTLEPGWRNVALVALAIVATLTASINLAWFLSTWTRFMRFLRRLASFPAMEALERLGKKRPLPLNEQLAWSGSEGIQLIHAVDALGRLADADPSQRERYSKCRTLLDERLSAEATRLPSGDRELPDLLLATSAEMAARRADAPQAARECIDDFAASLVHLFIPRYVRHFRLFVPPMILGCLCSVFLPSLYFVQPQRLIGSVAFFWVAVTVVVVLVSYVSLEVDPVLSAVGGSTGGEVSSPFALARRIVVWGAVPVASYLAVDHPEFPLWVSRILDFVGKSLR